jgi:hypothetical protein
VETTEWGDVEDPRQLKDIIAGLILGPTLGIYPSLAHVARRRCLVRNAVACSRYALMLPPRAEMETKPTKDEILRMVKLEFLFLRSP